jgi:cysteine desulfurase/selenocysteine lyase
MTSSPAPSIKFDVEHIRKEFPILHQKVNGHDLVYLDNAATSQKPLRVINTLVDYYTGYNANIHRGIHTLAEKATKAYEATRQAAKEFINARHIEEVIFITRGVTEAINLVSHSYGRTYINKGDEIIVTELEHHSNIVPWQMVCEQKGAILKVVPILDNGELDLDVYKK